MLCEEKPNKIKGKEELLEDIKNVNAIMEERKLPFIPEVSTNISIIKEEAA